MAARAGGHKETFGGPTPHLSLVDEDEREKIQVKREKMKQRMTSMKVEAGLEEDEEVLKQKALEEAARIKQDFKIAQEARVDATGDIAVEDELGDRAYEGFGTVEAANTDKPLVPLMPDRGIILEAMISVTIGTAAETAVRVICTSSMICIGAELDKTYTVMRDKIPMLEIISITETTSGTLEISTDPQGFNSGRSYVLKGVEADFAAGFRDAWEKAKARANSKWKRARRWLRGIYNSRIYVGLLSVTIIVNFILVVYEAQIQPLPKTDPLCVKDNKQERCRGIAENLAVFDLLFTCYFVVDIGVNLYVHWFFAFVKNGWNIFDFIIVAISLVNAMNFKGLEYLSGARAFRIFRLAGKVESLRRIVAALGSSVIPMLNAFLIGAIFLMILSVLGTEFFKVRDPENFGTMFRTVYSLWLAIAFGSWDNNLPVLREDKTIDVGVLIYLIVVVIVLLWVALQVVVAVLLDNFIAATAREDQIVAKNELKEATLANIDTGGLESLLEEMLKLFDTTEQLGRGIKKLFHHLDYDQTLSISYQEAYEGMKKLNTERQILLTEDDWTVLIEDGKNCNPDGTMSLAHFEFMMRKQIKCYVQRTLTDIASMHEDEIEQHVILTALRMLLILDPSARVEELIVKVDRLTDDVKGVKGQLNGAIKRMETAAAAVLMSTGVAGTTKLAEVEAPRATQYMPEYRTPLTNAGSAGYPSITDPSSYLPVAPPGISGYDRE